MHCGRKDSNSIKLADSFSVILESVLIVSVSRYLKSALLVSDPHVVQEHLPVLRTETRELGLHLRKEEGKRKEGKKRENRRT